MTSKEYHLFFNQNDKYQQAFLFGIINNHDETIHICELYIITHVKGVECKTKIDFDGMARLMGKEPGGNIVKGKLDMVLKEFILDSYDLEVGEQQQEQINDEAYMLISAAESALSAHPITMDIDTIVSNLMKNRNG